MITFVRWLIEDQPNYSGDRLAKPPDNWAEKMLSHRSELSRYHHHHHHHNLSMAGFDCSCCCPSQLYEKEQGNAAQDEDIVPQLVTDHEVEDSG